METALYLLPVTLGDTPIEKVLPEYNREVIAGIRHFIVEDVRSARRFLRNVDPRFDIDGSQFFELNKHTSPQDIAGFLRPLCDGKSMGVISEAGCPAVAFNGQSFAFNGYLPIKPEERAKNLRQLEQRIYNEEQTQLFIETPYRNAKMIEDILKICRPQTKLCIAANITCEGEYVRTRTVKEWQGKVPDLSKIPCIFLLYKEKAYKYLLLFLAPSGQEIVKVVTGRCLKGLYPEFGQHGNKMFEYIGLQMLVCYPCSVCREKVKFKRQTLCSWLQLTYHQGHLAVHALVIVQVNVKVVAQYGQVYNFLFVILHAFHPAFLGELLNLLGGAECNGIHVYIY